MTTINDTTPSNVKSPKAIVFHCNINGLSIIRSLGRKGISAIAVDYTKNALGFSSRYTRESVIAPDPRLDADEFFSFVMEKAHDWEGSILIPTHDEELAVFSLHKEELSRYFTVPIPAYSTVQALVDKKGTYETAARLNVPVPKTVSLDTIESLESMQNHVGYPCLLKPRLGHEFTHKFGKKAFIIENFEELKARVAQTSSANCEMLVQELIQGNDDQLYAYIGYYDKESRPLAEFTGRKIRQSPPFLGVGRVAESTQTEELIAPSRRILKEFSFIGLCALEYKRDTSDNAYKLLDINGRSFLWMGLPIRCGVDFPWIMYNDLAWNRTLTVPRYKTGVKWIHESADILEAVRHPCSSKVLSRDYLSPYFKPKTFAVFARDDWKPAWSDWRPIFLRVLKRPFTLCASLVRKIPGMSGHGAP